MTREEKIADNLWYYIKEYARAMARVPVDTLHNDEGNHAAQ